MVKDSISVDEKSIYFDPHQNSTSPAEEKMHLFNVYPGGTAEFHGTCSLTTTTCFSGETTNTQTVDSNYARIHSAFDTIPFPDTVLHINDSLYGAPVIVFNDDKNLDSLNDVNNWAVIKVYAFFPDSFLFGTILRDYLSSDEVKQLTGDTLFHVITLESKTAAIRACNTLIKQPDFYKHYRQKILSDNGYQDIAPLVSRLIEKAIFLDTSGTVKNNPSDFEKTLIEWLNAEIILKLLDKGTPFSLGAAPVSFLYSSLKACKIFRIEFQEGTSPQNASQVTVRYFAMNSVGLYQPLFQNFSGNTLPRSVKVSKYTFSRGDTWSVTPLLFPEVSFLSGSNLNSLLLSPSKAVIIQNRQLSSDTVSIFDYKIYYPLVGNTVENGKNVMINGKAMMTFSFQGDSSNAYSQTAYISHWNTEITVQKTYSDNNYVTYHQKSDLVSR